MLSVVIATLDSEQALLPTLAALVPGAMDGLIGEVSIIDGGSRDDTAAVADAAGCNFRVLVAPLGRQLAAAASAARAPWLMFLQPGTVLDGPWIGEARRFIRQPGTNAGAATFRRGATAQPTLREMASLLAIALGAAPRPAQGLILSKQFYQQVGGHSETAADTEVDLLRRIGRRRIVTLSSGAFQARQSPLYLT